MKYNILRITTFIIFSICVIVALNSISKTNKKELEYNYNQFLIDTKTNENKEFNEDHLLIKKHLKDKNYDLIFKNIGKRPFKEIESIKNCSIEKCYKISQINIEKDSEIKIKELYKDLKKIEIKGLNPKGDRYLTKVERFLKKTKLINAENTLLGFIIITLIMSIINTNKIEENVNQVLKGFLYLIFFWAISFLIKSYIFNISNKEPSYVIITAIMGSMFFIIRKKVNENFIQNEKELYCAAKKTEYNKLESTLSYLFLFVLILFKFQIIENILSSAIFNVEEIVNIYFLLLIVSYFLLVTILMAYKKIAIMEIESIDINNYKINNDYKLSLYLRIFLYEKENGKIIFEEMAFKNKDHKKYLSVNKEILGHYKNKEKETGKNYDFIFLKLKKIEDLINEDFKRKNELENFKNL